MASAMARASTMGRTEWTRTMWAPARAAATLAAMVALSRASGGNVGEVAGLVKVALVAEVPVISAKRAETVWPRKPLRETAASRGNPRVWNSANWARRG